MCAQRQAVGHEGHRAGDAFSQRWTGYSQLSINSDQS